MSELLVAIDWLEPVFMFNCYNKFAYASIEMLLSCVRSENEFWLFPHQHFYLLM